MINGTFRDNPYGAFNFLVALGGDQGDGADGTIIGGFSDVSGLGIEVQLLRVPQRQRAVQHGPQGRRTRTRSTTSRSSAAWSGSDDLFEWLKAVRDGAADPRNVTITLLDEARQPVRHLDAAQRPAQEVDRPDAGRQGRRRGGDGGAARSCTKASSTDNTRTS